LAALLRDQLDLHGVLRNPKNPRHFDKYSLAGEDDTQLTAWMHGAPHARSLAALEQMSVKLVELEIALIQHFTPVISIDKNPRKLAQLTAARKAMTGVASGGTRRWQIKVWPVTGARGYLERERLDAALLTDEIVLRVTEAKTIIPSTKGLLAVTAARVIPRNGGAGRLTCARWPQRRSLGTGHEAPCGSRRPPALRCLAEVRRSE
jgi:hypothetical protein